MARITHADPMMHLALMKAILDRDPILSTYATSEFMLLIHK